MTDWIPFSSYGSSEANASNTLAQYLKPKVTGCSSLQILLKSMGPPSLLTFSMQGTAPWRLLGTL